MPEHQQTHQSKKPESSPQRRTPSTMHINVSNPAAIIQRARIDPKSLTTADVLQLQRTIGNRAVGRLLSEIGRLPSTAQQAPIQRQEIPEEEEPLQGVFEKKPEQSICTSCSTASIQKKEENLTGMPDNLKTGVESLSGSDLSDVRVHYNSLKPAEIGALAYTQGTDIHVAPGQERHLPHEAWHVVQQSQGRVRPTIKLRGMAVNDDVELEQEAEVMGRRAASTQLKSLASYAQKNTHAFTVKANLSMFTYHSKKENVRMNPLPIAQLKTLYGFTYFVLQRMDEENGDVPVQRTFVASRTINNRLGAILQRKKRNMVSSSRQLEESGFSKDRECAIQCFRIGKIPTAAFRAAHVASYNEYDLLANASTLNHDDADFTDAQQNRIINSNAAHFNVAGGIVPNPVPPPGYTIASDESRLQLWRTQELVGQVGNIDHIIPFEKWGCNDFRNARCVTAAENNPGPISRPADNDFGVVSHDTINIRGRGFTRKNQLNLVEIHHLLNVANRVARNIDIPLVGNYVKGRPAKYIPTHDGLISLVGAPGDMTNSDFKAIYFNLPQR